MEEQPPPLPSSSPPQRPAEAEPPTTRAGIPTNEEREKACKAIPVYSLHVRYHSIRNYSRGTAGRIFVAYLSPVDVPIIREGTLQPMEGTMMQPLPGYSKENRSYKAKGAVILKKISPVCHWTRYYRDPEAQFILNVPYHPNLVQIYEMFINDRDKSSLYFSMERMRFNILKLIQKRIDHSSERPRTNLKPHTLKSILAQILCGLQHIHKSGFIHSDIKPENILLSTSAAYFYGEHNDYLSDDFVVKIADFGLAQDNRNGEGTRMKSHGTKGFRAPEMLLGRSYDISTPSDIFSFGALAYEVATSEPLFEVGAAASSQLDAMQKNEGHLNDLVKVLGTPDDLNSLELAYRPEFGYWRAAVELSLSLGYELAEKKYADIKPALERYEVEGLYEIVRGCLKWNPYERVTIEELSNSEFFRGTCLERVQAADEDWVHVSHVDHVQGNVETAPLKD